MTPHIVTPNVWQIQDSQGMFGATDLDNKVIWAPRGTSPEAKAIRLHEVLHALTSTTDPLTNNAQAYTWLDDARIDYLVDDFAGDYRTGIREFRYKDIDKWLDYGNKKSRRQQIKAALLGRGYRMPHITSNKEDMIWAVTTLGHLSSKTVTHASMLEIAYQLDNKYPE